MFFLLLPAGVAMAILAGTYLMGMLSGGRNGGTVCVLVIDLPIVVPCAIIAVVEAIRQRRGFPAFFQGAAWNVLWIVAFYVILDILARHSQ